MFLKEIEIENLGIIREAFLAFPRSNPVFGVVGRYELEEDSGRSNRSGKTTFVEANEYLLFGKARTRHHSKLINRTARANGEGMKVRGVYELQDGSEIEIIRVRTNDGKGVASVTGFEGSGWAEVNAAIVELIGFSHDEYKNTACFSQGDIHSFMRSGPKEKRVLLLDWLDQTRWETRSEFSKQQAGKAEAKVKQLTGTLNALPDPEGDPDELEAQAEEAQDSAEITLREVATIDAKIEALESEYEEATEQYNLKVRKKQIASELEEVEEALEEAEQNNKRSLVLEEEFNSESNRLKEIQSEHFEEIGNTRNEMRTLQSKSFDASGRHNQALVASGVCPVLNEQCDRVSPGQVKELARLADKAGLEYTKAKDIHEKTKFKQSKGVRELERGIVKIVKKIRELGNTDTERFETMLDRLDGELEEIAKKSVAEVRPPTEITKDKTEASEEVGGLNRQLGLHKTKAITLREAAQRARDYAERRERIEASIEEARLDLGAWGYCAFMFGDRGIPNEFIKGAFETLETDINYVLGRMNCGLSIEFRPYRETKNLEPSCLACGKEFKPRERKCFGCSEKRQQKRVEQLVLLIHDATEGTESDFSLDSGGGQVLISFAVRLALLFFKVRQGKGETPPIILDEIAGMLDEPNRQAVINVVIHILTEEYGIDQIFWISHNSEIMDLVENNIVVTRNGPHSTVDWL